ncbi:IclR family transcriptional regulator [soil metagenome]
MKALLRPSLFPMPTSASRTSAVKPKPPRIRGVPAVSRAIAILRLLGQSPEPLGVKAIADELELVPSTCLHILRVLVDEELLRVDPASKRYTMGSGMLSLARSALEASDFATLSQPVLDRIAQEWNVSSMGVEISATDHMVVLSLSRSANPFRLHVDVGSRFPALVSATGRLVAAFSGDSWSVLEKKFKAVRWDKPIALANWKKEVEQARRAGYAVDRGSYISGVTLIAVPLLNAAGCITHTLVAAGLSDNLSMAASRALAGELRDEAVKLGSLMTHRA